MAFSLKCILATICRHIFMLNMLNILHRFSINNLGILQGYLPPKAAALVIEWASIHQDGLMKNWIILSDEGSGSFIKIEPLK